MAERKRHYILTLQRATGAMPIHCTTQHGTYEGDGSESEGETFVDIWTKACQRASARTGLEWTVENTGVLFYRLAETT